MNMILSQQENKRSLRRANKESFHTADSFGTMFSRYFINQIVS